MRGQHVFQVGAGGYDITGPAAELGMMGYAMLAQKTAGIHQRLRARVRHRRFERLEGWDGLIRPYTGSSRELTVN